MSKRRWLEGAGLFVLVTVATGSLIAMSLWLMHRHDARIPVFSPSTCTMALVVIQFVRAWWKATDE